MRTARTTRQTVDTLGRWPSVTDVVRANYTPLGEKRLKALVLAGVVRGGRLDDGNGKRPGTVFVDLDDLDRWMASRCIKSPTKADEKRVAEVLARI